ncbi:HD family phosphohydrolase [Risungbinella massiliensis]|uniref:HD family phosphohydrolase n=1 Tax=Risungbinella massiliensis TaxID=1329796 RepID=UPI00069C9A1D|nr:HD family phosphohydrolase [Risungbinella massiliensis]
MKGKKGNSPSKLPKLKLGNRDFLRRIILYAAFAVAFYFLLLNHVFPKQLLVQVGEISKETILSPITKVDEEATKRAKEKAANAIGPQYKKDESLTSQQLERIDRIFVDINRIVVDKTLREEEKITTLKELISPELSQEFYWNLVRIPVEELDTMRDTTKNIVSPILSDGVTESELTEQKDSVDRLLVTSTLSSNSRFVVREIARLNIVVNEVYDPAKTATLEEAARESVEPIPIKKGELIVSQGQEITQDHIRKMTEVGLLREKQNQTPYLGLLIVVATLFGITYAFLHRFERKLHQDHHKMLMLFSINLLTLLGMKVVALGENLEWSNIGYLAPVALSAMLITLLLDVKVALGSVVLLSIFSSLLFSGGSGILFDFRYGFVSLVSGLTGAYALAGVRKRSAILGAGLLASVGSCIAILGIYLLLPTEGNLVSLLESLGFGFASGIASAVLTMGFLPYLETAFSILSPMRLVELSNPNHPLLKKLLYETPGTYHHSIIVGNLAESAAESIGADGLLARVGAYYHDLGKTKRPQFFIENQINRDNPHDKISPHLSKTIIVSHPKDGVEMLKEHRIPEPLQDIAAQHHGTTLLKYFYFKAKEQMESGQLVEEDFRYPGPKAQFKEAAIVGICDCVEAAVRSLQRPTPSRIETMVRKIIQDRLEDGQFDECDLTFKELDLITEAICATLQGIFHSRIEYPEDVTGKGVRT